MSRLSLETVAELVASRQMSAVAVIEDALARIVAYDAFQPQTWIWRPDPDVTRAAAAAVDARLAAGATLPLAGVPFAVKDNIDVAGWPTTAACPAFAYIAERSATVVERLVAAGAVPMGKTNLDQFATGLVGTRSPYGAPGCVYNRDYISGGSSAGSAVAVAAGLVAFALGTDTAGSGRVPAAFNHLVGLKPSKGRWSTRGLVPACRSLDCVTVLANDLVDAARVDAVAAGVDPEDAYSRAEPASPPPLGTRLGVPRRDQRRFFGDGEAEALFESAVERAREAGFETVEVDIAPLLAAAQLLYGPLVAERTTALAPMLSSNRNAIDPTVRAILQGGAAVGGAEVFAALHAVQSHARDAERLWTQADLLLLPTTPTIYRIAEVHAEPIALNANLGFYTNFVNLLDMSAVAVPAGFRTNGTGFGVTFVGPAFADRALLDLAGRYLARLPLEATPALDLGDRAPSIRLAVVGAHLSGMPLHWQLASRGARLVGEFATAAAYRLYAMADSVPPKPALTHVGAGGGTIALEVYELDLASFGSFVAEVPPPLAIGTVALADGTQVKGFVAEPRALVGARDITVFGGWRAYLASL